MNREADRLPGLAAHYGLEIADTRSMEHALAYKAIRTGRVDLTDAYSTDGKLLAYPLRVLEDDRSFFPPYECAPIVRSDVLERHPEVGEALDGLAFTLPDERMRSLNYEVEENGRPFAEVARQFLEEEGLLGSDAPRAVAEALPQEGKSFGRFLLERLPITLELAAEHLLLTGVAVVLAILIAVPLGIFLTHRGALSGPILGAAGVIHTIPSLALLAFMIPIPLLGLGARSAVAALFLYALLPILRNTYTGIREVVRQAESTTRSAPSRRP